MRIASAPDKRIVFVFLKIEAGRQDPFTPLSLSDIFTFATKFLCNFRSIVSKKHDGIVSSKAKKLLVHEWHILFALLCFAPMSALSAGYLRSVIVDINET